MFTPQSWIKSLSGRLSCVRGRPRALGYVVEAAKPSKHQPRRQMPRIGIKIVHKVDRGQQIIDNPVRYFEAARARAWAQVERDRARLS